MRKNGNTISPAAAVLTSRLVLRYFLYVDFSFLLTYYQTLVLFVRSIVPCRHDKVISLLTVDCNMSLV